MSRLDDFDICLMLGLEDALTRQTLAGFISSIRERYGLTNSAYVCPFLGRPGSSEPFVLTSYSESWIDHYRNQGYDAIDPVYQIGPRSMAAIDWSRFSRENAKVRRLFDEARDAGVGRQGVTIPVRGPTSGIWGLFTVTSADNNAEWSVRRHALVRDLLHVAHYVHQRAYDLHAGDAAIDLNAVTKREIEALEITADGKSVAETAALMRISTETVKSHLDSARYKLQALNRVHAVLFGVQNSYDRLQVILARLIGPSRDAARVSVCREAEVRTPA